MPRWKVITRATTFRTRYVEAPNEKEAEAASIGAEIEHEEDENEETMSIVEVDPEVQETLDEVH